MKKITTSLSQTPFESIKHIDSSGEYWLARELMPLLGYSKWERFSDSLKRAQESCKNAGNDVNSQFFPLPGKTSEKGGRPSEDIRLTRYACYLIAQNGDSRKPEIALAQTYFAIQTRKQELAELEKLSKERKNLRQSTADKYKVMSKALEQARERKGKPTEMKHYVNEANLVNKIALDRNTKDLQGIAGQKNFRDYLSNEALYNIELVEGGNTWFIAQGLDYKERKLQLEAGQQNLEKIHDSNLFLPMFSEGKAIEGTSQQVLVPPSEDSDEKSA